MIGYLIKEAIVLRVKQEDKKAEEEEQKRQEREQWKKGPVGS